MKILLNKGYLICSESKAASNIIHGAIGVLLFSEFGNVVEEVGEIIVPCEAQSPCDKREEFILKEVNEGYRRLENDNGCLGRSVFAPFVIEDIGNSESIHHNFRFMG